MAQEWLIPAVIAVLMGSVVLTIVYAYLFRTYRQDFLYFWLISFALNTLRYSFTLINIYYTQPIFASLNLTTSIFNGLFLLIGTLYFVERELNIVNPIIAVIVSIYGIVAIYSGFSDFNKYFLPYLTIGVWFGISGKYLLSYQRFKGRTKNILGIILFLWAFHKWDFPFLRPIPWIAPFGFLLTALFELIFAIGTFILFFEMKTIELQRSEKKYKSIFSSTTDGILILQNYQIIDANPSVLDMTGYAYQEIVGMAFDNLFPEKQYTESFFEQVQLKTRNIETKLIDKNGNKIDCMINMNAIEWGIAERAIEINIRDITELNRYRQELMQKKKIDILDSLSAGIAHDFNNLLMGMSGNLSLLELNTDNFSKDQMEYLEEIKKIVSLAGDMIQQFQQFSSGRAANVAKIDVGKVSEDVCDFVRSTSDRSISIQCNIEKDTYFTYMTPSELHQVVLNLVLNSLHAIEIKTGNEKKFVNINAEYYIPNSLDGHLVPGNKYVMVQVEDNGMGMDEETLRNCFEPFYTTKNKAMKPGVGLGLTMVYNIIINRYHGDIKISSELGKGTSVTLYLPFKEEGDISEAGKVEDIDEIKGDENLLLVEDELFIATKLSTYLSNLGYTITHVVDGEEAINQYKENSTKFDLVILDINIPKISGNLVYKEIRDFNKKIPIIISTGYYSDQLSDLDQDLIVLNKPYELENLAFLIRKAIDN